MKFSIITPSFNQGRYITECLRSVKSQVKDGLQLEHVVMDGGSRDGTHVILAAWDKENGASNPGGYSFNYRIEADKGQTDAINKGLAAVGGDILAYLCSDDFYEPGALAEVEEVFVKNPEVDVVYGDYCFLEGESGWKRLKKAGSYSRERLLQNNFLGQPSVFFRRGVYERFGALDSRLRFCMDHEYWLRISSDTDWFYVPRVLAVCRLHGSAKTSVNLTDAWWETAGMAKSYGLGGRFFCKALAMQVAGKWIYLGKRLILEQLGKRRRSR